jgi:hypothetical protein
MISDHAEPDPTLHSVATIISAAIQTVSPLGRADASHPVRHFWPLCNQRFFCSRLRRELLVERCFGKIAARHS